MKIKDIREQLQMRESMLEDLSVKLTQKHSDEGRWPEEEWEKLQHARDEYIKYLEKTVVI